MTIANADRWSELNDTAPRRAKRRPSGLIHLIDPSAVMTVCGLRQNFRADPLPDNVTCKGCLRIAAARVRKAQTHTADGQDPPRWVIRPGGGGKELVLRR